MSCRSLVGGFFIAVVGLLSSLRGEVRVGDVFPLLTEVGLSGASLPATGGRVVLVDFWASWCAPCKSSFPVFARINADYAARGVVIVAVSVDEKATEFTRFVERWRPSFAAVRDGDQRLVRLVGVPAMPTTYLLGRDGRVRFVHQGFHGAATDREMRRQLDELLKEKP